MTEAPQGAQAANPMALAQMLDHVAFATPGTALLRWRDPLPVTGSRKADPQPYRRAELKALNRACRTQGYRPTEAEQQRLNLTAVHEAVGRHLGYDAVAIDQARHRIPPDAFNVRVDTASGGDGRRRVLYDLRLDLKPGDQLEVNGEPAAVTEVVHPDAELVMENGSTVTLTPAAA